MDLQQIEIQEIKIRDLLKSKKTLLVITLLLTLIFSSSLFLTSCKRGIEESLKRANKAWDAEDYETAVEEYERYLAAYPTGEPAQDARFQLANIYYFHLKRYEQARAHYVEFINQSPSHPNVFAARERLAEVLSELGRSYEAIAEYENLNLPDPDERRRIRLRIADLYYDHKNYSQALTEYEKVVSRADYDLMTEQALLREASIYHLTRSQPKLALPVYQRLATESADEKVKLRATYGVADCYAELFEIENAVKTLRSIELPAEQAYINKRISELEGRKREASQAREAVQKAGPQGSGEQ
ncbi:MAG: tetratricopeptide repeat protein [Acidobacteriota bacterium]